MVRRIERDAASIAAAKSGLSDIAAGAFLPVRLCIVDNAQHAQVSEG
jgi:hypothetical protein